MNKKVSVPGVYARKKSYEYEGHSFEADIKDGDIVKILDSGTTVQGQYGEQTVFRIKTRNGEKNINLNQNSINNLVDAYGDDSENYVGKDVKVWIVKAMVSGKLQLIAYFSDPNATMDDEGRFHLDGGSQVEEDDGLETIDLP